MYVIVSKTDLIIVIIKVVCNDDNMLRKFYIYIYIFIYIYIYIYIKFSLKGNNNF